MGTDAAYERFQCFYQSASCTGLWLGVMSHIHKLVGVCVCVRGIMLLPTPYIFLELALLSMPRCSVSFSSCRVWNTLPIEANFNPIFRKAPRNNYIPRIRPGGTHNERSLNRWEMSLQLLLFVWGKPVHSMILIWYHKKTYSLVDEA